MSEEKDLNTRQKLFCIEYLKDLNATQAAIRAGYSEDTAYSIGSENLKKPEIQDELSTLIQDLLTQAKIPLEKMLFDRLMKRAFYDVMEIVDLNGNLKIKEGQTYEQFEEELRAKGLNHCIDGINKHITESGKVTIRYKFADTDKAADTLQKYMGMIREKVDLNLINVSIGKPPQPEEAYPET